MTYHKLNGCENQTTVGYTSASDVVLHIEEFPHAPSSEQCVPCKRNNLTVGWLLRRK